jgi:hypothetical protein
MVLHFHFPTCPHGVHEYTLTLPLPLHPQHGKQFTVVFKNGANEPTYDVTPSTNVVIIGNSQSKLLNVTCYDGLLPCF